MSDTAPHTPVSSPTESASDISGGGGGGGAFAALFPSSPLLAE